MARLFLSYAEEDGETARELVNWLRGEGLTIYHWQDPAEGGARFLERIEHEIGQADAFFALLSPDFLGSRWCRLERDLAVHREMEFRANDPTNPFIYVLKIAEIPYPDTGSLQRYAWFNLTSMEQKEQRLAGLMERLKAKTEEGTTAQAPTTPTQSPPIFRNRSDELRTVQRALTNASGPHFWIVVAPPELGKSWFINRLNLEMAAEPSNWIIRLVDLSDETRDVCANAGLLLGRFFGLQPHTTISADTLHDIAQGISEVERPNLCLLDSAELLHWKTVRQLREYLSQIYELVQGSGNIDVRLAFVAASRRQDDWGGVIPSPALETLRLTEYSVPVVREALRELASQRRRYFSDPEFWEHAQRVHGLSEGLPALLVRSLQWIKSVSFAGMRRLEGQQLFEQLARPYMQDGLLSLESLFRWSGQVLQGGPDLLAQRDALERAFQVLAPYRLFTLSHLRSHANSDGGLRAALERAGWSVEHLWRAIGDTALLRQPLDEPWKEIYPAIRRLFYRYYYATDGSRADAHRAARRFYDGWADKTAGKEQGVVLVECLWHEAVYRRLEDSPGIDQLLMNSARRLSETLEVSETYAEEELREYTVTRMRNDEELQQAVGDVPGLFERLISIVGPPEE
jgi:TIR domain